ncbi:MAG: cytochrome c oxidase subunit 3 [Candidatus Acidiferrales bacterium]
MSSYAEGLPISLRRPPFLTNDKRGTLGIQLFIATEASLFAVLFATYWYTAKGWPVWPPDEPPKLPYAIIMLCVLLASSGVLHWGELQVKRGRVRAGKSALAITIVMGLVFLILSVFDYKEQLKAVSATQDSYSSIFYMTETLHAAHVTLGLCMLLYVLFLPSVEPRQTTPHRPFHNVALYWHFVDVVWIFVVTFLFIVPNIRR